MRGTTRSRIVSRNLQLAESTWGKLPELSLELLRELTLKHNVSVSTGDLILLNGSWYVTHSGLLNLARRNRCRGIQVELISELSDRAAGLWAFKAVVFRSSTCKGFVGYGDADPSNVSSLVSGAEMRVAETRAVNRALRKAYGIGICSVDEIGIDWQHPVQLPRTIPPKPSNGSNGHQSNENGTRVRDRLCQIIRQHKLDAELVKSYAVDFCGTKTLRDASREQVENFVAHLADCAAKDRSALLCQLNSYAREKAGAA